MNTFLKILGAAALVAIAFYCCPALFVPFGAFIGVTTVIACIAGAILFALAGVGIGALALLAGLFLLLAVGLSPVWVPVLILIGIIQLVRKHKSPRPTGPVAAS